MLGKCILGIASLSLLVYTHMHTYLFNSIIVFQSIILLHYSCQVFEMVDFSSVKYVSGLNVQILHELF